MSGPGSLRARVCRALGLSGFLLTLLPLIVLAGVPEAYSPMPAAPGVYRAATLDGGDSLDWSAPLDTSGTDASVFPTRGNPTVAVGAGLSVSGATATVYCGLYQRTVSNGVESWTFLGIAGVSTATGGAGTRSSGVYANDGLLYFDTAGASHAELRATDPSNSATLTLVPWGYGSDSRGAQ